MAKKPYWVSPEKLKAEREASFRWQVELTVYRNSNEGINYLEVIDKIAKEKTEESPEILDAIQWCIEKEIIFESDTKEGPKLFAAGYIENTGSTCRDCGSNVHTNCFDRDVER